MFGKIAVWLICAAITCILVVVTGCVMGDSKKSATRALEVVKLRRRDFPNPNEVRGILIYNAYRDYRPLNETPEVIPDKPDLGLVVGNKAELQKLLHRELDPQMLVADMDPVARISHMYATALRVSQGHVLIGCTERIVFVTEQAAYVRGFGIDTEYGTVLEPWMESKELYQEFRKIGYLKE